MWYSFILQHKVKNIPFMDQLLVVGDWSACSSIFFFLFLFFALVLSKDCAADCLLDEDTEFGAESKLVPGAWDDLVSDCSITASSEPLLEPGGESFDPLINLVNEPVLDTIGVRVVKSDLGFWSSGIVRDSASSSALCTSDFLEDDV